MKTLVYEDVELCFVCCVAASCNVFAFNFLFYFLFCFSFVFVLVLIVVVIVVRLLLLSFFATVLSAAPIKLVLLCLSTSG